MQKPKMERAKAIELKLDGLSYSAIGVVMGCSAQMAQQLCRPRYQEKMMLLKRSGDLCENCGEKLYGSGHIHHIATEGKTFKTYCALDNLAYLCGSCHRHRHSRRPEIFQIAIPISDEEKWEIKLAATQARITIKRYVRLKLGLDKEKGK